MLEWYDKLEETIGKVLRVMCAGLLGALLIIFVANITMRYLGINGMAWLEEVVTLCFAWMSFLGAAELWRTGSHFKVDFFLERIKKQEFVALLNLIINLISLVFFVIVASFSIKWISSINATTPALAMPTSILYASIPVSMIFMSIVTLRDLVAGVKGFSKR